MFGERTFLVAVPKAWNQLPRDVRYVDNTNTFKNKKLSYRRETALQGALVVAKSGRIGLGDDILRTSSTTVT